MKLLKNFELYELQWSRLVHFRSGKEATGGLEKKEKKEKVAGVGMGYCPFSKIESQYSRLYCGTQQAEQAHSRMSRHVGLGAPRGRRNMAGHSCDTARLGLRHCVVCVAWVQCTRIMRTTMVQCVHTVHLTQF